MRCKATQIMPAGQIMKSKISNHATIGCKSLKQKRPKLPIQRKFKDANFSRGSTLIAV
jgi:hypothetical protein